MSSLDVLASTIQDIKPELHDFFTSSHPLLDKVVKGQRLEKAGGPYVEFRVVTGGPGGGVKLTYGDEIIPATRRQNYTKGLQRASRSVYTFDIPGKDLAEMGTNPDAMAAVINRYPVNAVDEMNEYLAAQIARGAGSSGAVAGAAFLDGIITLNGIQDYTPDGTAVDGVFMAATPALQTNTVVNIPMRGAASNPIAGWYHQFGQITSFEAVGRETWRLVRDTANQQGSKMMGQIDLILTDLQQYENYLNDLDEHVETVTVVNDHVPGAIREGCKFGFADVFSEPAIDLSDQTSFSSTATQAGVAYFLNSKSWRGLSLGGSGMESGGFFDIEGYTKVPDQDVWRWQIVNHWNLYPVQLRNQGFVVGGATK